jgi:Cysteine-rich CPCC
VRSAPLLVVRWGDTDCPVCGLGDAFALPEHYDTCLRCGWVDDPDANARPDAKSETNETSLNDAILRWPASLVESLSKGPLSTFGIERRDDEIGGYDYLVDGAPVRALFDTSAWNLKSSIGPWPASGDWFTRLLEGRPETPTGRSRLYVCPLCGGDDYETSLSAEVHAGDERVIWSRIGLEQYNYSPEGWELDVRTGPAGFAFDANEYRDAFASASRARG